MNQTQETSPLGVSSSRLTLAYGELFPGEFTLKDLPQLVNTMSNWLERYHAAPEQAIATTNWTGKVTQALFFALGLQQPRTKKDMLAVLTRATRQVRVVEYELAYTHRVQVGVPSISDQDAIAIAEEAFDNATIWDDTPDMPLLFDDFEETVDNTLSFNVISTVARLEDLPPKDASVIAVREKEAARKACSLLLQACEEAKKSGRDSISLADLATACEAAGSAGAAKHVTIEQKQQPDAPSTAQFGTADSADLESGTWTFQMEGGYRVTAGRHAIMPAHEYERLVTARDAKTGSDAPAKVLVEVEDGACIGTYATTPIEVVVMDADKVRYREVYEDDVMRMIEFPDGIKARSVLSRGKVTVEPEFVQNVFNMKEAA